MHAVNVFATAHKTKPLKVDSSGKKKDKLFYNVSSEANDIEEVCLLLSLCDWQQEHLLDLPDDESPIMQHLGAPDTCMIRTTMLYL